MAKTPVCAITGHTVDRDVNAALNLRDWPESNVDPGPVGSSDPVDTRAAYIGGTDAGPGDWTTRAVGGATVRPARKGRPVAVRREAKPHKGKLYERVTRTHSTATVRFAFSYDHMPRNTESCSGFKFGNLKCPYRTPLCNRVGDNNLDPKMVLPANWPE